MMLGRTPPTCLLFTVTQITSTKAQRFASFLWIKIVMSRISPLRGGEKEDTSSPYYYVDPTFSFRKSPDLAP
jgi:hypothetical protein